MLHGPWYSRANVFLTKYFFLFLFGRRSEDEVNENEKSREEDLVVYNLHFFMHKYPVKPIFCSLLSANFVV